MNIARIEQRLVIVSKPVGTAIYDFDFDLHFACEHPFRFDEEEACVLRMGAVEDYAKAYQHHLSLGLRLVNSPAQHTLASELEDWYPRLADLTPRSRVFEALPPAAVIERDFGWPVFIKGSRQTSRHNPDLSVVRDRAQYDQVVAQYRHDPILHWQRPVVRELVALAPIAGKVPGKVRPSVEVRSFWWYGRCVGWGRYWYQLPPAPLPDVDRGLEIARETAARLEVPFLVVDIAQTIEGRWIVIECNDAQESGYAGISPTALWRQVLNLVGPRV